MKKIIILCFLLGFIPSVFSQTSNQSTPYNTVYTHLYNLQSDSYNAEEAAKAIHPSFAAKDRKKIAIKIKQILDANGSFVDLEQIPENPNYSDSTNKNRVFLTPDNKEIYLEKYGDKWYYSKTTTNKVNELHRKAFPFGTAFFIKNLPHHKNSRIMGLLEWQWLGILILLLASLLVYYFIRFVASRLIIKGFDRFGKEHFARKVIRPVTVPSGIIAASILINVFYPSLLLGVQTNRVIGIILTILIPLNALYILYQIAHIFGVYLTRIAEKTDSKMDDQLAPIIRKSLKAFIIVIGLVFILQNLNFNITGLLAGLSIGALALALAAQDTVKNFIGSFMIFIDKPFQIGDWISGSDFDGTVEEVGFRATRIRTFRNSVQYIPNGKLADMITDNNGKRKVRRFNTHIAITYDTPPEKIQLFNEGLRQMVLEEPTISNENYHIYLNKMGATSLDILFYVFFDVPEWKDELAAREGVILKIMELAEALDIRFAFPTQTVHIEDLPGKTSLTPIHNASKAELKERMDIALQNFRNQDG